MKKTIALDWLQLSFRGGIQWKGEDSVYRISSELILRDLKHGSKHFVRMAEVILNGELIGNVQFNPRNTEILDLDSVIFKADNRILYLEKYMNKIMDFVELTNLRFKHISQIDIALDAEQEGKGMFEFVDKLRRNTIRNLGQADYTVQVDSHNKLKYFRMGSSSSNKLVRCYYKKVELIKSQKNYIREFWEFNDMDTQKEVERVEISMRKKELYKYHKFESIDDLLYLENVEFLASLFESGCKKFFEFVKTKEYEKNKKDTTRCKKLSFFNLKGLGGSLLYKITSKVTTEIYRLKMFAKTAYIIAKQTKSKLYAAASYEAAKNLNLLEWYEDSQEKWNYEFNLFKKSGRYQFLTDYSESATGQLHFVKHDAYM